MNQNLHIITLGVKDFKKSVEFYSGTLGWKPASSSSDDIAFFQAGGVVLALYPKEGLEDDALITVKGFGFGGFTL